MARLTMHFQFSAVGAPQGTWDSLRRSVAGSINYQLSGNALWSCDTGGYFHALVCFRCMLVTMR